MMEVIMSQELFTAKDAKGAKEDQKQKD